MSRGFAAAARLRAGGARGRRPLRAHRAGHARMGYGGRVARTALTSRADAEALDAADPLAAFRDRFALGDGRRIYVDGNSLGPVAHRRPGGAREPDRRVARPARDRLERLGRGADGGRRPARGGRARGGAGAGARVGLDDRQPLQARRGGARCPAGRDRRPTPSDFPTDRYVLQGLAARTGRELRMLDADPSPAHSRPRSSEACAGGAALVVLSAVNYRSGRAGADGRDHGRRPRGGRARPVGSLPRGRRGRGRPRRGRRRPGRRMHLQVPERRPGVARAPLRPLRASRPSCARRSGAGSRRRTSSRWAPSTGRSRGSGGSWPGRRRSSPWRPSMRARRCSPRRASAGVRAKAAALTTPRGRPARSAPRAAGVHARDAARRRAARCARVAAPSRRLADLPGARRAGRRHPRLPRPRLDPLRARPALHALHRRLGRDRPARRASSSRASTKSSTPR